MLAKMLDLIMRLAVRPPAAAAIRPRRRLQTASRRDSRDAGRRVTSVRPGGRA